MSEEYEVIKSSRNDPDNKEIFVIVALNFVLPTYIKAEADRDINFGEKVSIDNNLLYYMQQQVGKVIEKRSVNDITVDTSYDIKYTGGYSNDGKRIYLDKDFPKTINVDGKTVDTVESIAKHHELTEKWLAMEGYEYQYAHIIATRIEREYVESLGVSWEAYSKEVSKYLHETYTKKATSSPKDLDISPYVASKDEVALEEIRETIKALHK